MGIYDRDYYREQPKGFVLGPDTSAVVILIIINVVLFFADVLLPKSPPQRLVDEEQGDVAIYQAPSSLFLHMAVDARTLVRPYMWWQFLTYGFAHATIAHLVGNMFTFGYFGRDIEAIYGRREFVRFYLFTILLCGVYWSVKEFYFYGIPGAPLVGASGAVSAVLFLFVLHYPTRRIYYALMIPMPAWLLGAAEVIWNITSVRMPGPAGGTRIAFDVHLLGIGFAVLYHMFSLRISAYWPGLDWLKSAKHRVRMTGRRTPLRVHKPDEDVFDPELEREGDRVLAKLNEHGETSLTPEEKKTLGAYSKQMQAKLRRRSEPD